MKNADIQRMTADIKTEITNTPMLKDTFQESHMEYVDYAVLYAIEAGKTGRTAIFTHFFHWLKVKLNYDGFSDDTVKTLFDIVCSRMKDFDDSVNKALGEITFEAVSGIERHYGAASDTDTHRTFLKRLLDKDRFGARKHIHSLREEGYEIADIYTDVMTPAMVEIGWLWQTNRITSADEHLASAITQYVMTTLYPDIFGTEKNGYKVLAAAIGNELHEIGLRMIVDIFEYEGYQTQYLGGNLPGDAMVEQTKNFAPDLILLSVTMGSHLDALRDAIKKIRSDEQLENVKIMVGGNAFRLNDSLYKLYNADAFASTPHEALKVGERLVKKS